MHIITLNMNNFVRAFSSSVIKNVQLNIATKTHRVREANFASDISLVKRKTVKK